MYCHGHWTSHGCTRVLTEHGLMFPHLTIDEVMKMLSDANPFSIAFILGRESPMSRKISGGRSVGALALEESMFAGSPGRHGDRSRHSAPITDRPFSFRCYQSAGGHLIRSSDLGEATF